jgi:hypothetical protein
MFSCEKLIKLCEAKVPPSASASAHLVDVGINQTGHDGNKIEKCLVTLQQHVAKEQQ